MGEIKTMKKAKIQYAYDEAFKSCLDLFPNSVYMNLPPKETPYPFVVLSNIDTTDEVTKQIIKEKITVTADFWCLPRQRKEVTDKVFEIKNKLRSTGDTRIINDYSTSQCLIHIQTRLEFKI